MFLIDPIKMKQLLFEKCRSFFFVRSWDVDATPDGCSTPTEKKDAKMEK